MGPRHNDVRRSDVLACYRAFLGREPESESVIKDKINLSVDMEDLLIDFIGSAEFASRNGNAISYGAGVAEVFYNENDVKYDVPGEDFNLLLARVISQWTAIGKSEPHWGVLSEERFRQANVRSKLDEFYATGFSQIEIIKKFCRKNEVAIPTGVCMELGCGVGRVTHALADHFEAGVIAFDVAEPMLKIARETLSASGKANCTFRRLSHPDDLGRVGPYDFFFSVIVLQHNPPPVMKRILEVALDNLRSGGVFFFQVPTYQKGYSFDPQAYISGNATKEGDFEMHVLPMHVVLDVIHGSGCRVKEVISDNSTGNPGSHIFFGVK